MTRTPSIRLPYPLVDSGRIRSGVCIGCSSVSALRSVPCWSIYPGGARRRAGRVPLCITCLGSVSEINQQFVRAVEVIGLATPDAIRRWAKYDGQLFLSKPEWDVIFPIAVFSLLREARRAFVFGSHLACITQSSGAVEAALNAPTKLKQANWLTLRRALLGALDNGLPVNELLEPDEVLKPGSPAPLFVERRNKAAHGELSDKVPSGFVISPEPFAADQLCKAQRFLVAWAKSPANPATRPRESGHLLFTAHASDLGNWAEIETPFR